MSEAEVDDPPTEVANTSGPGEITVAEHTCSKFQEFQDSIEYSFSTFKTAVLSKEGLVRWTRLKSKGTLLSLLCSPYLLYIFHF